MLRELEKTELQHFCLISKTPQLCWHWHPKTWSPRHQSPKPAKLEVRESISYLTVDARYLSCNKWDAKGYAVQNKMLDKPDHSS